MSDNSRQQAFAQVEGIVEMVKRLENARESGDQQAIDEARNLIHSDPLSVQVRTAWEDPNRLQKPDIDVQPHEYKILLCTGGPAVRIIGNLNEYGRPRNAYVEHQDWNEPWTKIALSEEEAQTVIEYARHFYYRA